MKGILKKITTHTLVKNSAIMFIGGMAGNVAAYVYHLVVGRVLGPSGYGELSSFISVLYVLSVPIGVIQMVLVKQFAACKGKGRDGEARSIFLSALKVGGVIVGITSALLYLFTPVVVSYLHVSSEVSFYWVIGSFAVSTLSVVAISLLLAYQKFLLFAAISASIMVGKLIISVPAAHYGVSMVLLAGFAAYATGLFVYLLATRFLSREKLMTITTSAKGILSYMIPTFLALFGMTSLYSIDIMLVKHYFNPSQAGLYAAVALLGKMIFYASSAVISVLFPVVAERVTRNESYRKLLSSALLLVFAVSLGVLLIYTLAPSFVLRLLFGPSYVSAEGYVAVFGVFMTLYSLSNVFISLFLAIGRTTVWLFTIGATLLQIAGISLWHAEILQVIWINIAVSALLFLFLVVYYYRHRKKAV